MNRWGVFYRLERRAPCDSERGWPGTSTAPENGERDAGPASFMRRGGSSCQPQGGDENAS